MSRLFSDAGIAKDGRYQTGRIPVGSK